MSVIDDVAALYVEANGVYASSEGVDVWDVSRDARRYRGPKPVVAHPPCERWGRYWSGGPSAKVRRLKGDDDGCFAHAIWSVRTFGGVLEHPEASHAWRWFGLNRPPRKGGWVMADALGGMTCCVEQGRYGHGARKATWLYAVRCELPDLDWGASATGAFCRLDRGFHSAAERASATNASVPGRLTRAENIATTPAFAALLLDMARSVGAKPLPYA